MSSSKSPSIVLVHVHSRLPKYLLTHLRRLTGQFPNNVYLITDSPAKKLSEVNVIHPRDLPITSRQLAEPESLATYALRPKLWLSSFQRLQLVGAFAEVNEAPTIHLESDVLVLWPQGVLQFAFSVNGVSFPVIAENLGIASTLVISDPTSARDFLAALENALVGQSQVTEMEYLGAIAGGLKKYKSMPRDALLIQRDCPAQRSTQPQPVFDGAAMGVFLLGVDPIHTRARVKTRTKITRDDLDAGRFSWRLQPATYAGTELDLSIGCGRVATLHANSKEWRLFDPDSRFLYNRIRRTLAGRTETFVLSPRAVGELSRVRAASLLRRSRVHLPSRGME